MAEKYDIVWIKDLSKSSMSHFEHSCRGIITSSYREQYGGGKDAYKEGDQYTVFIEGKGECSWYEDWCFSRTEHGGKELLEAWKRLEQARQERESSRVWLFSHPECLKDGLSGDAICTLAEDLGIDRGTIYGKHGEYTEFLVIARAVLGDARPYIKAGDLEGWYRHCREFREDTDMKIKDLYAGGTP